MSVVPDTVHTDDGDEATDTGSLLEAVASNGYGVFRRFNDSGTFNLSDWLALVTEMDFVTADAAL